MLSTFLRLFRDLIRREAKLSSPVGLHDSYGGIPKYSCCVKSAKTIRLWRFSPAHADSIRALCFPPFSAHDNLKGSVVNNSVPVRTITGARAFALSSLSCSRPHSANFSDAVNFPFGQLCSFSHCGKYQYGTRETLLPTISCYQHQIS